MMLLAQQCGLGVPLYWWLLLLQELRHGMLLLCHEMRETLDAWMVCMVYRAPVLLCMRVAVV